MEIVHANVISGGRMLSDGYVRTGGGRITEVGPMAAYVKTGCRALDAKGKTLCAGYIDQHTHGAMGHDVMEAGQEAMDAICRHHLAAGDVAFLPTTMTASLGETEAALSFLQNYRPPVPVEVSGVHMEGPFLSIKNRGAHPQAWLCLPCGEWLELMERYRSLIRLITVSPELPGMPDFIRFCRELGVVASGGHDDGYDQAILPAIDAGLGSVTHIYCCSSGITREGSPKKRLGLTELALVDDRLYVEAIADGNGVPHSLLPLIYRAKGPHRVIFVSDSMAATGLKPGRYILGGGESGVDVDVTKDAAILHGQNLFAGSIATLSKMVADAVQKSNIPLVHAVLAATKNPAALLGLHHRGDIAPGMSDGMNLLEPDGTLRATIIRERVYIGGVENHDL